MITKLDRQIAPKINYISNVEFVEPKQLKLKSGAKIHYFDTGEQDVVKIEFHFRAGTKYSDNPLVAQFASKLMTEGTSSRKSSEIAEKLDFMGAHLMTDFDKDYASVSLVALNKYIGEGLEIVADIILNAIFPEEEIEIYLRKIRSDFEINNMKVAYLSRKHFGEKLFGANHYYGRAVQISDFEEINKEMILDFYNKFYKNCEFEIFASGKVDTKVVQNIDERFGVWTFKHKINQNMVENERLLVGYNLIEKPDAIQNAIRSGKFWADKSSPDWHGLKVLNVILGGYFGSRLMKNIREDKGLTYGIGSGIGSLEEVNYFFISTEVKSEMTELALQEIKHEINILREEYVGEDELQLVKSYIQGSFRRSFDGPFIMIERFKSLYLNGLDYNFYADYITKVKSITPFELKDLAVKYLDPESFLTVVVGK